MLRVFIDFKSAGSLLAMDPIVDLSRRYDLPIDWCPFSTTERDLPDKGADVSIIESHRRARVGAMRRVDRMYAELRGVELSFPDKIGSCNLALGALALIKTDQLKFIRAAFDAYWKEGSDLNSELVVRGLFAEAGFEQAGSMSELSNAFAQAQSDAESAGVVEAPAIIADGQLFIGRQHLPWIEENVRSASQTV